MSTAGPSPCASGSSLRSASLPAEHLLLGSDFPVPVFELSAGLDEVVDDFKAVLKGRFERLIVPQDNLLDVDARELFSAFPGHPLFTNFSGLLHPDHD